MAVAICALPYAREGGGLATAFDGARLPGVALLGGNLSLLLLVLLGPGGAGAVAFVGAMLAGVAVLDFARARLGGYTGDVLGAAGIVAETVGLLVAAAW